MFQESFEGVLGGLLSVFETSSKGVLKQFQGSFWRVLRKFLDFHQSFKSIIEVNGNFEDVSKNF